MPVRLWDAMTITSALDFLAASKIPADKLVLKICSVFALMPEPRAVAAFLNTSFA